MTLPFTKKHIGLRNSQFAMYVLGDCKHKHIFLKPQHAHNRESGGRVRSNRSGLPYSSQVIFSTSGRLAWDRRGPQSVPQGMDKASDCLHIALANALSQEHGTEGSEEYQE